MAKRSLKSLSEREILALAVHMEEEDSRVYGDFADGFREEHPVAAKAFDEMQAEELNHRERLVELYRQRFGAHIPLVRRHDVSGFAERRPVWLRRPLRIPAVRKQVELMEFEAPRFYERAAKLVQGTPTRKLLEELGKVERKHAEFAESLERDQAATGETGKGAKSKKRTLMLQFVQPGLEGLIDGSVSTLAPIFAAAFATHQSRAALLVGLAASLGAGISMMFAEALSDDGSLTGRGHPYVRGAVIGVMTAAGGLGHTLPFLLPNFHAALTVAVLVVAAEMAIISYVRHRFMETTLLSSAFQVVVGGAAVFAVGVLIGSS